MWGFGFMLRRFFTVSSNDDIPPPPINSDYLMSLGQLTQGYRALDTQLFGVAVKVFDISMLAALAIFGGGDPKRTLGVISRYLNETYRNPNHEAYQGWKGIEKKVESLISKRNEIIHSIEIDRSGEAIQFLRFASTKPVYQRGQYSYHTAFSEYTPRSIAKLSHDFHTCCNEMRDWLGVYQSKPPSSP